jgi:hypothetical protein
LARWRASRFATLNAGGVVLVKLTSVGYFVLPDAWPPRLSRPQSRGLSRHPQLTPTMAINDIYSAGIASGWKVLDAATFTAPRTFEADVAIVGSGAGGGIAAEMLTEAGFKVLIEEGALHTSDSFKDMDEARAYRELYQEAARARRRMAPSPSCKGARWAAARP